MKHLKAIQKSGNKTGEGGSWSQCYMAKSIFYYNNDKSMDTEIKYLHLVPTHILYQKLLLGLFFNLSGPI